MKLIKILLILVIIAVVAAFFFVDTIAKNSIEKYGSEAVTTRVVVGEVHSDIFEQQVAVRNISVANPTGFAGEALTIGNVAVDVAQVGDTVVISSITFDGIVVNVTQSARGINLLALKDAVSAQAAKHSDHDDHKHKEHDDHDEHDDMRIKVGSFSITGSIINVDTDLIKEQIALPDITLRNIGGDAGMMMSEFAPYIIGYLTDEVQELLSTQGIDILGDKLEQTLVKRIGDKLGIDVNTTDDITNSLENSLGDAKEGLQEKTEELKNQLNEQKEKLKNIFKF